MVNPFPFRIPYSKYNTWLENTWLNEVVHTDFNFIVYFADNQILKCLNYRKIQKTFKFSNFIKEIKRKN